MRFQHLSRRTLTAFTAATVLSGVAASGALAQSKAHTPAHPFTMSFHNADAADVLRAFALQSGLSLAVSPSVKGKLISIRLQNVSADEALKLITQAAGVTFRRTRNAYLVGSEEDLKKIHASDSFASYPLKHLTVSAAKTIVEGMLPYITTQGADTGGVLTITGTNEDVQAAQNVLTLVDVSTTPLTEVITPEHVTSTVLAGILRKAEPGIAVETRDNTVIMTGSREAVTRAKAIVPSADSIGGSAQRIEVYRIRYSSASALATMLTSALPGIVVTPSGEAYGPLEAKFQPLTGGASGSNVFSTTTSGSSGSSGSASGAATGGTGTAGAGAASLTTKSRQLILTGPDAQVDAALRLLKSVDIAPAQVSIEARVVDIELTDNLDLGIQWGSSAASSSSSTTTSTTPTFTQGVTGNTINEQNVPSAIQFGRFVRSPFDFASQLQFLQTKSHTKTLADPRISVIDNEDASIFIGDVLRYQILAVSSSTAGNGYTVEEVPVGIALLVRPRVNDNGEITIKVHPAVSTLTSLVSGLPQTAAREADTTLRVHDGETIAIGGLIRDQDIQTVQEVPLLAKLPFFGELFRNRSNQKEKSDIVIFLTIHLLPDTETGAATPVGTTASAGPTVITAPVVSPVVVLPEAK